MRTVRHNRFTLLPCAALCAWGVMPGSGAGAQEAGASKRPPLTTLPPAMQDTPEHALRAFMNALFSSDAKTLYNITVPMADEDFAYLTMGQPMPADMLKKVKAGFAAAPIRRLKAGDTFTLPNGSKLTVSKALAGPDSAVLVVEQTPLPYHLQKADRRWLVDASPIVAARKAAARVRKAETGRAAGQSGADKSDGQP